jgi:hypothetical protein
VLGLQGFSDENQKNLRLILDAAEEKLIEYNDLEMKKKEKAS